MTAGTFSSGLSWKRRAHRGYFAFLLHRISGLLLALFLPVHFWALGTAIAGEARLTGFLDWTKSPLVKFAEVGLVVLLAAHLTGGVRLLLLEFVGWRDWQQRSFAVTAGIALLVGLVFLLNLGA